MSEVGELEAKSNKAVSGRTIRRRPPRSCYAIDNAPCATQSAWTATLVDPRMIPFPSLNRTKTRFTATFDRTRPVAVTKTASPAPVPAAMGIVTDGAGGLTQLAVAMLVWQSVTASGRLAVPVSTLAVRLADAPTLTAVTANAPWWAPRFPI
jgi:hypothetical protein